VPREFVFVGSLPRNAMGKVQHFRLKEQIAQGVAPAATPASGTEQNDPSDRHPGLLKWFVGRDR
jgi:hypothetical protein